MRDNNNPFRKSKHDIFDATCGTGGANGGASTILIRPSAMPVGDVTSGDDSSLFSITQTSMMPATHTKAFDFQ